MYYKIKYSTHLRNEQLKKLFRSKKYFSTIKHFAVRKTLNITTIRDKKQKNIFFKSTLVVISL